MKKLLIGFMLFLTLVVLSGCSEQLQNVEYVKFDNDNGQAYFKNDQGKIIRLYAAEENVELLETGQKYSVQYAFDNFLVADYVMQKVVLSEK